MSDGFYRAPCKTCQGLFMPRDEKNVFCCRECARDYHHLGRIMERQRIREQLRRAVEVLNGDVNPPIPLPNNPSANGGLKLTHPGLVPEGLHVQANGRTSAKRQGPGEMDEEKPRVSPGLFPPTDLS